MGWVSKIHPAATLPLGLLYLITAGLFCPTLVRAFGFSNPIRWALSHFVILSAGLIAVFAGLSSALHSLHVTDYDLPDRVIGLSDAQWSDPWSKEKAENDFIHTFRAKLFVKYYGWLYIDMIPVLEVWQTLDQTAPLKPKNKTAGLLVIGFRCMVIMGLIASWREWKLLADPDSQTNEHAQPDDSA